MSKELSTFLSQRTSDVITDIDAICAAVAVPLVEINGEDHLLFTVRSLNLRRQPGEISFPGGHYELDDPTGADAAIRECSEELGISIDQIELIGPIDCLISAIGVKLHAVVVRLHTTEYHPNPDEVKEIFTVPLREMLAIEPVVGHLDIGTKPKKDFPYHLLEGYHIDWKIRQNYSIYFYPYEEYTIWGLTGRVLKNFLDIYKTM
ncbi:NUDIX hydrolase [Veillonella agrestimuris]|uniref:NUDIX hydrolase n=1 Tax=Veillonella agrestimuris TaxID=2941340 RepID=UPI00203D4655|nr:CoA pyrophosphatase [Veillonella agrestimuris]